MATKEELKQSILDDAAAGIDRATIDGNTVDLMSVDDRHKVLDKDEAENAKRATNHGLRFSKIRTQGAMGT